MFYLGDHKAAATSHELFRQVSHLLNRQNFQLPSYRKMFASRCKSEVRDLYLAGY